MVLLGKKERTWFSVVVVVESGKKLVSLFFSISEISGGVYIEDYIFITTS